MAEMIDSLEHAAVRAWSRVSGNGRRVLAVRTIRGRAERRGVWRLDLAGDGPTPIVAKRCRTASARIEKVVYESVLSRVPVASPRFFGSWEEGPDYSWLFFEDAGEERFSPEDPQLRAMAGRWLAAVHLEAPRLGVAGDLPKRDMAHYLDLLRVGRVNIRRNLKNPELDSDELKVLYTALDELGTVESEWDGVAEFCHGVPDTLVHGDFRSKNIFVRRANGRRELLPIDWETAGWGIPAADLGTSRHLHADPDADLAVYARTVRSEWPHIDEAATRRLSAVGLVFRRIMAIAWASESLQFPWTATPVARIGMYVTEIAAGRERGAWPP